jgi:hypothetical protein
LGPIEKQGFALSDDRILNMARHQFVVPRVNHLAQATFDAGQTRFNYRGTGHPLPPPDASEFVTSGGCECPAKVFLTVRQNVDTERARLHHLRPTSRRFGWSDGHHRRIEGQRRERLARETDGRAIFHCRNDRDARGEATQYFLELPLHLLGHEVKDPAAGDVSTPERKVSFVSGMLTSFIIFK